METFPLQKGSSGQKVKTLQQGLNVLSELRGWTDRLEPDGQFGEKTKQLLYKLLNHTQVTDKLWRTLEIAAPHAITRLAEFRRTGKSADVAVATVVNTEAKIFHWLLQTYATWDKMRPAQRAKVQPAFDAAFNIAARQRARMKKYDQATKDIMWQRGVWDPKYLPLVKKYVEGGSVGISTGLQLLGAVCIGGLIFGVVSTIAVIDWLAPAHSESTVDFKKTKEVQEILDKLPPEDQVKLEAEIETQIDKAYDKGHDAGNFGGIKKIVIPAAVGLTLLFLYERYGRAPVAKHYGK